MSAEMAAGAAVGAAGKVLRQEVIAEEDGRPAAANQKILAAFARFARSLDIRCLGDGSISAVEIELPFFGRELIYIRDFFYPLITEVLAVRADDPARPGPNALISGTTGNGKSLFGFVLMLAAVSVGKPCTYWSGQALRGMVITPAGEEVVILADSPALSNHLSVGALQISDTARPQTSLEAQTVVITEPSNYHCWKEFMKQSRQHDYPIKLTLPTFSLKEMEQLVALGCNGKRSLSHDWRAAFALCGGIPRYVLFNNPDNKEALDHDITIAVCLPLWAYRQLNSGPFIRVTDDDVILPERCFHYRTAGQRAAEEAAKARAAADAGGGAGAGAASSAGAGGETSAAPAATGAGSDAAGGAEAGAAAGAGAPAPPMPLQAGQAAYYEFDGLVYASEAVKARLVKRLATERSRDMLSLKPVMRDRSYEKLWPVLEPVFARLDG